MSKVVTLACVGLGLLAVATSASAECAWVMWGPRSVLLVIQVAQCRPRTNTREHQWESGIILGAFGTSRPHSRLREECSPIGLLRPHRGIHKPTQQPGCSRRSIKGRGYPPIEALLVIVASISLLGEPFRPDALSWFLLTQYGRHQKTAGQRFVEYMRPVQELAERGQLAPMWERANPYFAKHSPGAGLLVAQWQQQLAQKGGW